MSDGHNYINAAIAKGAVVVVVEDMPVELNDGVVYLQVEILKKGKNPTLC